jgi:hypothetical protein
VTAAKPYVSWMERTEQLSRPADAVERRQAILDWVADLGTDVRNLADPGRYSFDCRARAQAYVPALNALRAAYRRIRDGADPLSVAKGIRSVLRCIERNQLERMIDTLEA